MADWLFIAGSLLSFDEVFRYRCLHADSFDHDYRGVVEDMAGSSGPLFSLFPPENATGNYVKIVQRFPVRVHIEHGQDPAHDLRPGMSVEARVRVN